VSRKTEGRKQSHCRQRH